MAISDTTHLDVSTGIIYQAFPAVDVCDGSYMPYALLDQFCLQQKVYLSGF